MILRPAQAFFIWSFLGLDLEHSYLDGTHWSAEDSALLRPPESLALGDPPRLGHLGRREGSPAFLARASTLVVTAQEPLIPPHPHFAVERASPPGPPGGLLYHPRRLSLGHVGDSVLEIQIYFLYFPKHNWSHALFKAFGPRAIWERMQVEGGVEQTGAWAVQLEFVSLWSDTHRTSGPVVPHTTAGPRWGEHPSPEPGKLKLGMLPVCARG